MAFTTHDEYIESNKSEKVILAHLHGSKRLYNFVVDGSVYSRTTDHFVNTVKKGTTALTRVSALIDLTDDTKFFFDINLSKLYLFDFDQDTTEVIVEYRFFLSNVPIVLSWDLTDAGDEVEYEPRIISAPKFKSTMSQGKKGINLIGGGSFKLNNNDGFYDEVYDTIFFDNKDANMYSFNRDLVASEAKQTFRGAVIGKSFSTDAITYKVNDVLYKLDEAVPTTQYGSEVNTQDSTNHKRVIYGRNDNLLCQSIDQHGNGIAITGSIYGVKGEDFITGEGTDFINELSEGDELIFGNFTLRINSIKNATVAIVSELETTFGLEAPFLKPSIQYKNKNRTFQVAGHAIKRVETTISGITSRNRIDVADATGFAANDTISIDGEIKEIRRVSGNTLVLNTNYNLDHAISDTISKREIFNVRYGENEVEIDDSEITIDNATGYAKFTIDTLSEINSAKYVRVKENFSFFNNRDTIWLGTPAIYELTAVAQSDGSLYGTYFIIEDIDARTTAFWFKDSASIESSQYTEPAHGADNNVAVTLLHATMTDSEVAQVCIDAILSEVDYFQGNSAGAVISLESRISQNILTPTVNTSGFSIVQISTGVATTADIDLSKLINPRDYIKHGDAAINDNYEVLSVEESSIRLRRVYGSTTEVSFLNYKNVQYIEDNTKVYVNCYGKTKDGTPTGDYIQYGSEAVLDMLTDVGLSSFTDTDSFDDAAVRAPQLISLTIPTSLSSSPESVKKTIHDINKSLLGSLFINTDLDLGYDILDSEVPLNVLRTISEDDLISWSVKSDGFDLSKNTVGKYRFVDYDPDKNDEGSSEVTYTSDFVEKYIGNENTTELETVLYNEADAQEFVERNQFINSLSNATIKLSGKMSLSKFNLGERVLLDLTRLYVALGSTSNTERVGVITSLNNTGEKVEIEIEDMGALYARSARVTDNSADDYITSTESVRVVNSYITDENEIIEDNEDSFSTNLIS
jgi:hypothetical protein